MKVNIKKTYKSMKPPALKQYLQQLRPGEPIPAQKENLLNSITMIKVSELDSAQKERVRIWGVISQTYLKTKTPPSAEPTAAVSSAVPIADAADTAAAAQLAPPPPGSGAGEAGEAEAATGEGEGDSSSKSAIGAAVTAAASELKDEFPRTPH